MRPLLIISLLGCFIAACGGGDSISADEADRIASELAQKTQALSSDVADAGRALAEDPDRADEARDRLRNLEDPAQDLAGKQRTFRKRRTPGSSSGKRTNGSRTRPMRGEFPKSVVAW